MNLTYIKLNFKIKFPSQVEKEVKMQLIKVESHLAKVRFPYI